MLAAVLHDFDDLRLEEIPPPQPTAPGTVLVRRVLPASEETGRARGASQRLRGFGFASSASASKPAAIAARKASVRLIVTPGREIR